MEITLSAKQFAFIIAFMPDRGQLERFKLINQIARQLDDQQGEGQLITVDVPPKVIADVYYIMGQQPQRLTGALNNELKAQLLGQIQGNAEALALLQQITQRNAAELGQVIAAGFDFLQQIKS